jgi:hypothetical protein
MPLEILDPNPCCTSTRRKFLGTVIKLDCSDLP